VPQIRTQAWCMAQEDPQLRHQWIFMDGVVYAGTHTTTLDPDSLELNSQRVEDTGYMHRSEIEALADENGYVHVGQLRPQTKKYILPPMGQHHTLNGSGRWGDMDEPDSAPMVAQDMDVYTTEQNRAHFDQLYYDKKFRPYEEPAGPAEASVVTDLPKTFNPNDHAPSVVIGYLMGQDDTERRRVVAAEMRGSRKSDKILNHPDWKGL
jgi:hypothetical protein